MQELWLKFIDFVATILLVTGIVSAPSVATQMASFAATTTVFVATTTAAVSEQRATNPYAGWNTFSDGRYFLEFKYPGEWEVTRYFESEAPEGAVLHVTLDGFFDATRTEGAVIDMEISKHNPKKLSIIDFLKQVKKSPRTYAPYREMTGVEALRSSSCPDEPKLNASATDAGNVTCLTVNFTKGGYVYNLDVWNVPPKELEKIFDSFQVKPPTIYMAFQGGGGWTNIDNNNNSLDLVSFANATLGYRAAPAGLKKTATEETYKEGAEIYALTLPIGIFRMSTDPITLHLHRIDQNTGQALLSNKGNIVLPKYQEGANRSLSFELVFVVPESTAIFYFSTEDSPTPSTYPDFSIEVRDTILIFNDDPYYERG